MAKWKFYKGIVISSDGIISKIYENYKEVVNKRKIKNIEDNYYAEQLSKLAKT